MKGESSRKEVLLKDLENPWVWSLPKLSCYTQSVQKLQSSISAPAYLQSARFDHAAVALLQSTVQKSHPVDSAEVPALYSHTLTALENISRYVTVLDLSI